LIKPLGRPQRYCVKHYSRDVLAQQITDINWLAQGGGGHSTGTGVSRTPGNWRDSRNQGDDEVRICNSEHGLNYVMNATNFKFHRRSPASVISLSKWLERVGVTPITAWRWRKKGWLRNCQTSLVGKPNFRKP